MYHLHQHILQLTKNTWIGSSGTSCNITNDDTDLFYKETLNKSVQERTVNIKSMEKSKIHVMALLVDGNHTIA